MITGKNNNKKVAWEKNLFLIDNKPVILYSGEFHYFRVPCTEWETRLKKAVSLGINCISTYIPWNWHEIEENCFTWEQQRDVGEFLSICKGLNLYVIIKPGPYICAEWDSGGFPDWIYQKNITLRSPDPGYLNFVTRWYKEVIKRIKPYLLTQNGTIILFQIENEYEHYLHYDSTCRITYEEARQYIKELLNICLKEEIDIPVYLNGSHRLSQDFSLLNGVDFWPDIPFLWNFEFQFFNNFLAESSAQYEKPLFISELQTGWYDQVGEKHYEAPNILEANIKNAVGFKSSIINLFMLAGGTTPPHYNCKGDSILCKGTENTTSYDFGAPIRECGEYNFKKAAEVLLGQKFINSFQETILHGQYINDRDIDITTNKVISFDSKERNRESNLSSSGIICKILSYNGNSLVYINNLKHYPQKIKIKGFSSNDNAVISLRIDGKKAYLLPGEYRLADMIINSNAEMFFLNNLQPGSKLVFLLLDNKNKLELSIKTESLLYSESKITKILSIGQNSYKITHPHGHIGLIRTKSGANIFLIPVEYGAFIKHIGDFILFPKTSIIQNERLDSGHINFELESNEKNDNKLAIFSLNKKIFNFYINDVKKRLNKNSDSNEFLQADFNDLFTNKPKLFNVIKWKNEWMANNLDDMIKYEYDDSSWAKTDIRKPIEMIQDNKHGYVFYRAKFTLTDLLENYELDYDGGENHKSYIYLNGNLIFSGKGKNRIKISGVLKEDNVFVIKYLYHFHTKGYQNSGPFLQYSGVKNFVLLSCKNNVNIRLNEFKINFLYMENVEVFHENGSSEAELSKKDALFISENFVHLRRKFYLYDYEKEWDIALGIKITEIKERALIYINNKLIGKYEDASPQHTFFIPKAALNHNANVMDLIIEGPGFNSRGEIEFPLFRGIDFIFMHCNRKIKLKLEYENG